MITLPSIGYGWDGSSPVPSSGISVTQDGPASVYTPESVADCLALGLPTPTSIHKCNEASGNLADSVGSDTLTANGTAGYQQTVSGWTRKFITFTEDANERFSHATAIDTFGSGVSYAVLVYAHGITVTANRDLMLLAGSTSKVRILTTTGYARLTVESVSADGTYDYQDGAAHPFLFVYDDDADTAKLYTDKEAITGTHSVTITDGLKGIGGSGTSPPACSVGLRIVWHGAAAVGLTQTVLSTLGWSLAY